MIVQQNDEQLTQLQHLIKGVANRILGVGLRQVEFSVKEDLSLVTQFDQDLQTALLNELRTTWPDFTALAEESANAEQRERLRQSGQPLWIIDPLDGTSNFVAGLPCFAISVAQMMRGKVERAVVFDPVHNESFAAMSGRGAYLNGVRLPALTTRTRLDEALALVDSKRLSAELAQRVAVEPPFRSQRNFGAAALEWCWLAAGRGDVYLHGKQQIWDYAAGELILREAGGLAVNLDGDCISPAMLGPSSVVAAGNAELFQQWCCWLGIDSPRAC